MLKAAHVLAMDSKNLLDATENARRQGTGVGVLRGAGGLLAGGGGRATPPLAHHHPAYHRRTPSGGSLQYALSTPIGAERTNTATAFSGLHTSSPPQKGAGNLFGQQTGRPPGGGQFPQQSNPPSSATTQLEHHVSSDCDRL